MPDIPPDEELLLRSKVSPHLRAKALDWERRHGAERSKVPVPREKVVIELKGPENGDLRALGIDFTPLLGNFYSAEVPLDRLDDIARLPNVLRIHHEPRMQPTLDDSIPEIRGSSVRNKQFPFNGTNKFTGAGVVIGIIDSGINYLHPVFRLPNDPTKTRIRVILDQTQTPSVTFNRGQIEAAIATNTQLIAPGQMVGGNRVVTDNNDHKHGTHVASIAGGSGKQAGNCGGEFKYVGVAPDAEFVIVKYDFTGTASVLAAIQFIAGIAAPPPPATGGVPCVINMSFGHSLGPHDGTDAMDQIIDAYLATVPVKPVVLVASAGNDGEPGKHATGTIPPGGVIKPLRLELNPQKSVTGQATSTIDIRFTAPNGLGCRLIPPGNNTSGGTNLAAPDGAANFTETTQNSTCAISGTLIPGVPNARRVNISIVSAANGVNQSGEWRIELTNAGAAPITYHAWSRGDQWDKIKDDVSRANTVGSPGSATNVITVGNYHSSGKDEGKLSDSSSRGPRLDGLQKPDVSAPGEEICSARRDFYTGCCCDCCCDSYIDMSGTSMAAPHVTGAIALMLERNPALTHSQIKGVLLAQARRDSFTGAAANSDFGNGKLDVLALLNDPLVRGAGPIISASAPASVWSASPPAPIPEGLPDMPPLEEGTPLWRLLNTPEGRRLYQLARVHWRELHALVNTQKRVAAVWHRSQGPLLLHHALRTSMLPHVPLPTELNGVDLGVRAARMVSALERYASKDLIKAMHATLPLVRKLQGKTLLELVEMFEASAEL